MTIFSVNNASELTSALAKAQGGDRIELGSGNYGDVAIKGKSFASNVTITAQDSSHPPVFNTIKMVGSSNIVFDSISVDFHPTTATKDWTPAFQATSSHGIQVLNSTFVGGNSVGGIDPNNLNQNAGAYGVKGFPIGQGMSFVKSSDITVDGNKMTGFTHSVKFVGVDNIQLNNNEISDFRKVPVSGSDLNNVHLEGNYFHDANPWNFGPKGDHGDFVHFWTTPKQTGASQNFVFVDNFFDQGNGKAVLGIYLDDNTNNKGFTNVLIEDNIIHNGNGQALRMEDVVGLTIRDNTIVGTPQNGNVIPKIILDNGTKNVLIDNNIYSGVGGVAAQNAQANGIVFGHNVTTQITDASKPDYAGYIFAHGVTGAGAIADFNVIAGSLGAGMGAHVSGLPHTPSLPSVPSTGVSPTSPGTVAGATPDAGTAAPATPVKDAAQSTADSGAIKVTEGSHGPQAPTVEKHGPVATSTQEATTAQNQESGATAKVAIVGDHLVVAQATEPAPVVPAKVWAGFFASAAVSEVAVTKVGAAANSDIASQIDHFATHEEVHLGREAGHWWG
jgi:hypothetical protein